MKRFLIGVLAVHLIQFTAVAVRAERLEAIWIGPDGNDGEGDWNTPTNWNLGVVPHNGTDADGDGVPDIFDVRIDALSSAMSFVRTDGPEVEVAGLRIDHEDVLELTQPLGFVLHDPDSMIDVLNNGLIRIGGPTFRPSMMFRGEAFRLSGTGCIPFLPQ